jgi:S-DNA-T family DNA segregation ATPase FtsK/SpoIIIE
VSELTHGCWAAVRGLLRQPLRLLLVLVVVAMLLVVAVVAVLVVREASIPVAACVLAALGVVVGWRLVWPASFQRRVSWRARAWWRRRWVYRRRWAAVMQTTGLTVRVDGTEHLPRLRRVRSTATVDRVTVRLLVGQLVGDYAAAAARLAQAFGARECRVRTTRRGNRVELWFLIRDPLTHVVPPIEPPGHGRSVDLAGLPVAVGEDGAVYRLRLLGTHVLVVGATGSGKGSVIWSLLHALAPAIRDHLVWVWAVDPKGGMELAPGARLFARFAYGDPTHPGTAAVGAAAGVAGYELEFASVLEDAVAVMRRRQAVLRGVTRLHTPSVAEPLLVVVVDEIASLTAYVTDRDAKRRIAAALALLLSQGRAVGVLVVGAVQDPRKEVLSVRDLFPTRVLLRVTEPDQVALVLGASARDRGARAELIPESLPGVGYVGLDGTAETARVRFTHHTDEQIARLVADYAPRVAGAIEQTSTSTSTSTGTNRSSVEGGGVGAVEGIGRDGGRAA